MNAFIILTMGILARAASLRDVPASTVSSNDNTWVKGKSELLLPLSRQYHTHNSV